MTHRFITSLALLASAVSFAGTLEKKAVAPVEDDRWKFALSMPGWIAGVDGTVGLNGINSDLSINPSDAIRHLDMAATFRGEASKGRFGIMADFVYLSLSDGIGTNTVVKKVDIQLDETMGDLGMRWRVVEGPRGWIDVTAGVRYWNLYQKVVVQPNSPRITDVSENLVDAVSSALRTALKASQIGEIITAHLSAQAITPEREASGGHIPIAPLRGRDHVLLVRVVRQEITQRQAELTAAVQAAERAVGTARVVAQQRVKKIKGEISQRIADKLEDALSARVSRTDDWFDPYVGLRARYNFNDRFYVTAKGDIGGFGVGSELTWQAEGAFGWQVTPSIFAEVGYRALSVDYEQDGLLFDTITHGAQINVGLEF